jgi:hypothetical protein
MGKVHYTWKDDRDKLRGLWVRHISGDYEAQITYLSEDLIGIREGDFNWLQFHELHTNLDGSQIGRAK